MRPWLLCIVQSGPHLAALWPQNMISLLYSHHVLSAQWLLDAQYSDNRIERCFLIDLRSGFCLHSRFSLQRLWYGHTVTTYTGIQNHFYYKKISFRRKIKEKGVFWGQKVHENQKKGQHSVTILSGQSRSLL